MLSAEDLDVNLRVHFKDVMQRLAAQGVRIDGRALAQPREVHVSPNAISRNVDGSAVARLGGTSVVCGVTARAVVPPLDAPTVGILTVVVDAGQIPAEDLLQIRDLRERASALETWIAGQIKRMLDFGELVILAGAWVWQLTVSMHCVSNDGNLEDAALLSCTAALNTVQLDGVAVDPLNPGKVSFLKGAADRRPLPVRHFPLSLSFGLFGDAGVFEDCTRREEEVADSRVTVVYNEKGELCGVYKPGGTGMPRTLLEHCCSRAKMRALELHSMLLNIFSEASA